MAMVSDYPSLLTEINSQVIELPMVTLLTIDSELASESGSVAGES